MTTPSSSVAPAIAVKANSKSTAWNITLGKVLLLQDRLMLARLEYPWSRTPNVYVGASGHNLFFIVHQSIILSTLRAEPLDNRVLPMIFRLSAGAALALPHAKA